MDDSSKVGSVRAVVVSSEPAMTFGQALECLKRGEHVARTGWNGKNMHLYLEDLLSHTVGGGVFKGHRVNYEPCICMFTAQGTHQPGWLASQADMLSNDWCVVAPRA